MLLPSRNTQRLPVTAASTLLRLLKPRFLSLHEYLGIMQIFPHRDVDMWSVFEWAALGGRGRILTLIKNTSLVLRLKSLQLQGSYLCIISLKHSKEKAKLEIASYDPFKKSVYDNGLIFLFSLRDGYLLLCPKRCCGRNCVRLWIWSTRQRCNQIEVCLRRISSFSLRKPSAAPASTRRTTATWPWPGHSLTG